MEGGLKPLKYQFPVRIVQPMKILHSQQRVAFPSPSEPLPSISESPGGDGDQGVYFDTLIQVSQTTVWLHSYVLHAHVH